MKRKKRLPYIVVIIFFWILLQSVAFATIKPTNEFYVNDYANLLSSNTEQYIVNTNQKLNNQTGAQVVVITVKNLEGMSLEEYATKVFREFGIGDRNKNNGVLMLLALQERQSRIEVGYGLEGVLTDGKTGRIQDEYMIPFFKNNQWDTGIVNGFNAIMKELEQEYDIEIISTQPLSIGTPSRQESFVKKDVDITLEEIRVTIAYVGLPVISILAGVIFRIYKWSQRNKCRFSEWSVASQQIAKLKELEFKIYIIFIIVVAILNLILTGFGLKEMFVLTIFEFILFIMGLYGKPGRGGGGYSSGSGGHGRRWRIFWRWRFFRWRRKFKKLLRKELKEVDNHDIV